MKKLVLGIIAVCCAQLAYTAYNATEASRQEFARVVSRPIVSPFFPGTSTAELEPSVDEAVDLDVDEVRPAAAATMTTDRPNRRRKFRRNQVVTYQHEFETTKIVVPKGEKYVFKAPEPVESKVASFTAKKEPRTVVSALDRPVKKRSFLDKTGSVIKKPFRWLKDLFAKND
ncbi:MAG: hypothetical protein UZ17_ACD001002564 [Acidobacteria bacterium OLB17]|nr:MAG: hypothetical protein UZ17_ACD001002564 [Acidobacteria bacterium OLB17]MCZ2390283.1 hypothetical protein [Acidobacteriota bacterium]